LKFAAHENEREREREKDRERERERERERRTHNQVPPDDMMYCYPWLLQGFAVALYVP